MKTETVEAVYSWFVRRQLSTMNATQENITAVGRELGMADAQVITALREVNRRKRVTGCACGGAALDTEAFGSDTLMGAGK